ncbi:MAG: RNA 2',3'-cyclic phosphodiesterase [Candidatus Tyrphobacter sp.]
MRLFIGIELNEHARAACAEIATRLEASGLRARFVEAPNYHMTLAFLGNVDDASPIDSCVRDVAGRHAPFAITIERVGAFPHERRPRIVFAGSRGVDDAYCALAADVREACERLGYRIDHDVVPHVTLARIPRDARIVLPIVDVAPFGTNVEGITLFESVPLEGKTRYDVRARALLPNAV